MGLRLSRGSGGSRRCPGAHPHDPIAQVDPYVYAEPVAIFKAATRTLLALDQIQDPHNLGALLRSAYALGVEGVLVSKDRSAEITPTVVRTSAGASELLAVCRVAGLPQQLETIKRRGFWIVGADMDGVPLGECRLWSEPIVVVMGAEGEGLRQTTRKVCDQLVRIPIRGSAVVDSLNVSVAGGILLWEVARAKAALPLG